MYGLGDELNSAHSELIELRKRNKDAYDALKKILGNAEFGKQYFYLDKVTIEGIMGLLSGQFEGER